MTCVAMAAGVAVAWRAGTVGIDESTVGSAAGRALMAASVGLETTSDACSCGGGAAGAVTSARKYLRTLSAVAKSIAVALLASRISILAPPRASSEAMSICDC